MSFIFFPVVVHAMDIVVSSVGILYVTAVSQQHQHQPAANPMDHLTRGYRCVLCCGALCRAEGFLLFWHCGQGQHRLKKCTR